MVEYSTHYCCLSSLPQIFYCGKTALAEHDLGGGFSGGGEGCSVGDLFPLPSCSAHALKMEEVKIFAHVGSFTFCAEFWSLYVPHVGICRVKLIAQFSFSWWLGPIHRPDIEWCCSLIGRFTYTSDVNVQCRARFIISEVSPSIMYLWWLWILFPPLNFS